MLRPPSGFVPRGVERLGDDGEVSATLKIVEGAPPQSGLNRWGHLASIRTRVSNGGRTYYVWREAEGG